MFEVLTFWDREEANLLGLKITVLTFLVNKKFNEAFQGVYFFENTWKNVLSPFIIILILQSKGLWELQWKSNTTGARKFLSTTTCDLIHTFISANTVNFQSFFCAVFPRWWKLNSVLCSGFIVSGVVLGGVLGVWR